LNAILLFFALTGGGTLIAVMGLLLVRRKYDKRQTASDHEVGGYMLSILGTLYAVVLGFVVVDVSEQVRSAKADVSTEVNSILNINRFADGLPDKSKQELNAALVDYTQSVADVEWPMMPKGVLCKETWFAMKHIWRTIKDIDPQTPKDQAFYSSIIESYNQLQTARRNRLIAAAGYISPVLWMVLIGGATVTIIFTYFFSTHTVRSQVVMTSLVAVTLGLNLYLVVVYSSPFSGDFKISPISFRLATAIMQNKTEGPPANLHFKKNIFGYVE
jgi:hypothetical protein